MKRLYFYWKRPEKEQLAEAESLGALLRDSRAVGGPIEQCDEVYGDVPREYEHLIVKPKPKKVAKKKAQKDK